MFLVVRVGLIAVVLFAVSRLLDSDDLDRAKALVVRVGWPIGLAVVPTLLAMMLDARGWQIILRALGHNLSWRRMLELRLSAEAIVLAVPGGSVAGEAAKVALLRRRAGVALSTGLASLALTKMLLIGSDAVYLLVSAVGIAAFGQAQSPAPLVAVLVGATLTGTVAVAMHLMLHRPRVALFVVNLLSRAPSVRIQGWANQRRDGFEALDRSAARFFQSSRLSRAGIFVVFLLEWLTEGVETFLILRLLGAPIGWADAFMVDSAGSLLRALAFFVPAGLGIQDVAQVMLLGQLGIADPVATGTAYVVVKRSKEVFWIVTGLLFLAVRRDLWLRTTGEGDQPTSR